MIRAALARKIDEMDLVDLVVCATLGLLPLILLGIALLSWLPSPR